MDNVASLTHKGGVSYQTGQGTKVNEQGLTPFAKHANEAIHVISEKNKWKEGSPEKVLLHAFVGGMTAQMGGDTVLAGAIPGAVNEIFSGALQRYEEKYGPISPDQRQWLALVGGVITNYATGHTLQTGGAVAAYGTKWNKFGHNKPDVKIEQIALGVDTSSYGHVSLIVKFEDGTYQEGNFGRYATNKEKEDRGENKASEKFNIYRQGTYVFDDAYQPEYDYKKVYLLNKKMINASNVAWAYNKEIDKNNYQEYTNKESNINKLIEMAEGRESNYFYRIPGSKDDYKLLNHNCVTTSIDPLFYGANFNVSTDKSPTALTLRFLQDAIMPHYVAAILEADYQRFKGTGLVESVINHG